MSVIVPAFNVAATILKALGSVKAQTYPDWEIVVVDDGSTDGTLDVVAAAAISRLVVLRSDENHGLADARNRGIEAARGQFVAFLDADDHWLPTYLESQVRAFDDAVSHGAEIGIVACDAYIENTDGSRDPRTYRDVVPSTSLVTVDVLLEGNPVFVSVLAPRDVVQAAGSFDVRLRRLEDRDLWLRIVELGYRVVHNPEPLAVYRIAPDSLSSRQSEMARGEVLMLRFALERGRLTPGQRRLARSRIRVGLASAAIDDLTASGPSARSLLRAAWGLGVISVFAIRRPRRWSGWIVRLCRREPLWRSQLR